MVVFLLWKMAEYHDYRGILNNGRNTRELMRDMQYGFDN